MGLSSGLKNLENFFRNLSTINPGISLGPIGAFSEPAFWGYKTESKVM
jgi:hypothetical protein